MIHAAIDPGARWIACTITRDDGLDAPLRFIDARAVEVGQWVEFGPEHPKYRQPHFGPWTAFAPTHPDYRRPTVVDGVEVCCLLGECVATHSPLGEHVATPEDRRAAGDAVAAYLIAHGVEACDVENVEGLYGDTVQAVRKMGAALIASAKVAERALTLWESSRTSRGLTAPIRLMLAASWRARLVPLIKAMMVRAGAPVAGVLIKGKGSALDPLFAAAIDGWPGASRWSAVEVEHIRDSTGLALACALPALPTRKRGSAGPRLRRERRASKARPRGSRARAAMGPIDLEKHRATDRAREQRERDAAMPARLAARAAAGCSCRAPGESLRGRHKATCPMHKPRRPLV